MGRILYRIAMLLLSTTCILSPFTRGLPISPEPTLHKRDELSTAAISISGLVFTGIAVPISAVGVFLAWKHLKGNHENQNQTHDQLDTAQPRTRPLTEHIATPAAVFLRDSPPQQPAGTIEAVLLHVPSPTESAATTGTTSDVPHRNRQSSSENALP